MSHTVDCKVGGMTCGNCALTITRYLQKQGATDAVANPATGELHFQVESEMQVKGLFAGIEALGYSVQHGEESHAHASATVPEKKLFLFSLLFWIPLIAHMFLSWAPLHKPWVQLALCTPVYLIGFIYFGRSGWRSLQNGIPNMDVLVFLGSSAAYFYSLAGWYLHPQAYHSYLFFETAASIITLVLLGNYLEANTVRSTSGALQDLMQARETMAQLILTDSLGKETIQAMESRYLRVGDLVLVRTGDQVPADGVVQHGQAAVDESMMSGESLPVSKQTGENVIGGTMVVEGVLRVKTTAVGSSTVLSQMIQMVNQAQAVKPPMQKLADKISAVFVPAVLLIAVLSFVLNYGMMHLSFAASMMRSIAVMVISCPCAMGLATPAAIMVGLGRAARMGILIKDGKSLESFRHIRQFVFDKTGTLTTGRFQISSFHSSLPEQVFKDRVLAMERQSAHPIAQSILQEWTAQEAYPNMQVEEKKGHGMTARDENGDEWKIGSARFFGKQGEAEHDLYVYHKGVETGWINLASALRPEAATVLMTLRKKGYRTILLSGDHKRNCEPLARDLALDEVHADMWPDEKAKEIQRLNHDMPVAMVGDGINDAPSLASATIGISLSDATHLAQQSAGVILMQNRLTALLDAIQLGRYTYQTIVQNLFWAFAYNVLAIPVAACGYLTPTWGAGIMAISDIVLIANSLRLKFRRLA